LATTQAMATRPGFDPFSSATASSVSRMADVCGVSYPDIAVAAGAGMAEGASHAVAALQHPQGDRWGAVCRERECGSVNP
jgi:hypothetical protein